jgi:hypothetical protein
MARKHSMTDPESSARRAARKAQREAEAKARHERNRSAFHRLLDLHVRGQATAERTATLDALVDYAERAAITGEPIGTLYYRVAEGTTEHIRLAPRDVRFRLSAVAQEFATRMRRPTAQTAA